MSVCVVSVTVSTPPLCELVLDVVVADVELDAGFESLPSPQPAATRAIAARIEISRFIRGQGTKPCPAFLRVL